METRDSTIEAEVDSYSVNFVADVNLVKILGEQLISSEKVGILELIKNAYDANASICQVVIEKVPGLSESEPYDPEIAKLPGPVITILDDGQGMDRNIIEVGWLRPATRLKTSIKERLKRERKVADERGTRAEYESLVNAIKKEYGGRLPLGEKGVGRFATHRLGRYLQLKTKSSQEPFEWVLETDWNDFETPDDAPRDLNTVKLILISQKPSRDYGPTDSGTMIRIYGGREGYDWTEKKLLEIGQAIAHLRSPSSSGLGTKFEIKFIAPQLSEEIEVPTETIPAPFECIAIVDEEGKADIEIRFCPPESLSKPIPGEVWTESIDLRTRPPEDINPNYWLSSDNFSKLRLPYCGPFTVDIKTWLRTKEWIDDPDWREFTNYLDEFGGIGFFRDGMSILPAQISSRDDWLKLSSRHIKRGIHISYYMMSGSVDLVQEKTLGLVDRTSREGMLETQAFEDLRELLRTIVFSLEFRVIDIRDRYNRLKLGERIPEAELNTRARTTTQVFNLISKKYDFEADLIGLKEIIGDVDEPKETIRVISKTIDELRREIKNLRNQRDALVEAAGYGVAIAVAIHEIEKVTSNIFFGLDRLQKKAASFDGETYSQIDLLHQASRSLLNELKRLAPLRVTRLERKRKFRVRDSILAAVGAFRLSWNELNITFYQPLKNVDFDLVGSFGACSQVFANLFDNSTYWLRSMPVDNRRIITQMIPDKKMVVVADSGPGISDKMRPHLFELYYSLKSPPSGLGLYICRYYMRQMKGSVRESYDEERIIGFEGAHFTLIFPEEE